VNQAGIPVTIAVFNNPKARRRSVGTRRITTAAPSAAAATTPLATVRAVSSRMAAGGSYRFSVPAVEYGEPVIEPVFEDPVPEPVVPVADDPKFEPVLPVEPWPVRARS
jgi:hypothetical protein